MSNVGFYWRKDAEAALRMVRNQQQFQNLIVGSGWIVRTPSGGIPALFGLTPGKATCDAIVIDKTDTLKNDFTNVGDPVTIDVYNLSTTAVGGDVIIGAWEVHGVAIAGSGGGSFQCTDLCNCEELLVAIDENACP